MRREKPAGEGFSLLSGRESSQVLADRYSEGPRLKGSVSVARLRWSLFSVEGPGEEVPGSRNRRQGTPASGGGTPGEDRTSANDGDTWLVLYRTPTRG
jgi:hypothetical protein